VVKEIKVAGLQQLANHLVEIEAVIQLQLLLQFRLLQVTHLVEIREGSRTNKKFNKYKRGIYDSLYM
jgi:hypothetical protein